MTEPRITTRCPSCGHQTLVIGGGWHLVCSWLECKEPILEDWLTGRWLARHDQQQPQSDIAKKIDQLRADGQIVTEEVQPVAVRLDGKTWRQAAIDAAHDWQRSVAAENTPTPSPVYLIVRDLLSALFEDVPTHDYPVFHDARPAEPTEPT